MFEKKKLSLFAKVALLAFFAFCAITVVSQYLSMHDLEKTEAELQRQQQILQEDIDRIQDQLDRPFDEEYIQKVAREKLGYHLPQEIIFYNDLTK